jgi:hypothetical protein
LKQVNKLFLVGKCDWKQINKLFHVGKCDWTQVNKLFLVDKCDWTKVNKLFIVGKCELLTYSLILGCLISQLLPCESVFEEHKQVVLYNK